MTDYDFTVILRNRPFVNRYAIPFHYGPFVGLVIGFFITLAKSPPFIAMDCVYGAFLGFMAVLTYNLFVLSMQPTPPNHVNTEWPDFKSNRARALYLEMQKDRLRYQAMKLEKELEQVEQEQQKQQEQAPISMRTRSKSRRNSS